MPKCCRDVLACEGFQNDRRRVQLAIDVPSHANPSPVACFAISTMNVPGKDTEFQPVPRKMDIEKPLPEVCRRLSGHCGARSPTTTSSNSAGSVSD
jgi:hypothetical protein